MSKEISVIMALTKSFRLMTSKARTSRLLGVDAQVIHHIWALRLEVSMFWIWQRMKGVGLMFHSHSISGLNRTLIAHITGVSKMEKVRKTVYFYTVLAACAALPAEAQQSPNTQVTSRDMICQADLTLGGTSCAEVSDVLPNAETAYTVGMAILRARYGASVVKQFMPYEATSLRRRQEDTWCLTRKYPKGALLPKGGGHPTICLLKRDGRVVEIGLSA
jgi:hypothetical protein